MHGGGDAPNAHGGGPGGVFTGIHDVVKFPIYLYFDNGEPVASQGEGTGNREIEGGHRRFLL
nr:MAG TPA: hypothetical protein [Bacteriophage sp.]